MAKYLDEKGVPVLLDIIDEKIEKNKNSIIDDVSNQYAQKSETYTREEVEEIIKEVYENMSKTYYSTTLKATLNNDFDFRNNIDGIDIIVNTKNKSLELKLFHKPYVLGRLFENNKNIETIEEMFDTSECTNFGSLFYGCENLKEIKGIENWNTENVEYIGSMFFGCKCLKTLDLSGWDSINITNVVSTFEGCISLETLNLSNWDFENIGIMDTFYNLPSLKNIIGPIFNIREEIYMPHSPLTTESALVIIDGLTSPRYDNSNTVTFNENTYVPSEKIAEATAKGWTITFGEL